VGHVRGVAERACAFVFGDQCPDGAAGHPRPARYADPASGQQQEAAGAPLPDSVILGQITIGVNWGRDVRWYGPGPGGPDDGEVGDVGGLLLSGWEG